MIQNVENNNDTETKKIFELLELGTQKLNPSDTSEAVVVIGTTGSGKSAFIQWITGDNSNLISKETFPGSKEYVIEDENGKIGASVLSKTLFPEFETDVATGTTYYDLPGFNDTRSSSHDIAASFFIKSVFDHIKNVKILFVTSYYTVKTGMDRIAFPALLKNIEELIRDVTKFKKSIALVVTKVDNKNPDSVVFEGIAHFLREIKKVFEDHLNRPDISDKKRRFSTNSIEIINILLSEKNGEYTRITLFRAPYEQGQMSKIVPVAEGKKSVQEIIFKELIFTRIDLNDFNFTIADSSKLEIDNLVSSVNNQMTSCLKEIIADIRKCLDIFVEPMRMKIDENNLETLSMTEAIAFATQYDGSQEILAEAVRFLSKLSENDDIVEALTIYLTALRMEVPQSVLEQMSKLLKYLEFFKLFRENLAPVSSLQWTQYFQSLLNYLFESIQFIRDKARFLIENINSEITSDVDSVAENVKAKMLVEVNQMIKIVESLAENSVTAEVDHLKAQAFHGKLTNWELLLTDLEESLKVMSTPGILVEKISNTLNSANLSTPNDVLSNISRKSLAFETLQNVSGAKFIFPAAQWANSFEKVLTCITSENISNLVRDTELIFISKVGSSLSSLVQVIQSNIAKKTLQLEIHEMKDELNRWRSHFVIFNEVFQEKYTLNRLIDDLTLGLKYLNFNGSSVQTHLKTLSRQEKFLGFLKAVRGDVTEIIVTSSWKACITAIVECFDVELNFNTFLVSLHQVLSQFTVQNDVSRYNVANLSHWGAPSHPQGILIDKIKFKLFLEKVKDFNIEAANNISNIMPNDEQILSLNNILNITLNKPAITQCPAEPYSKIILKANFIKFSDFLDSNGIYKEYGWDNISSLEVYALNTIFIDQDLDAKGTKLKLSMVAPKWEVIGTRRIHLDGKAGQSLPNAQDGEFPGGHGLPGLPGLAGGSAGAFFGVAGTIVSSENLTISANGGKGGLGQSGGNGAKGEDGETPPVLRQPGTNSILTTLAKMGFKIEPSEDILEYITVFGRDGMIGGNGGSPGVGGFGGLSGKISVISLDAFARSWKILNQGERGDHGDFGSGGLGGCHGDNRILERTLSMQRIFIFLSPKLKVNYIDIQQRGLAENGLTANHCNPKIPDYPLPAATIRNVRSITGNFARFFIENSSERFVRFSTQRTCMQIIMSSEIYEVRNTFGLIEDYKLLQSFSRHSNLNLAPLCESYLISIENYARNPKENENSDKFKKVLSYLYAATLILISNLRKHEDSDLIIDIGGYLDTVSTNVKNLCNLHEESQLFSTVETLKNNFKSEIEVKIKEAQCLLQNVVTPEFSETSFQFHNQISMLATEVAELQKARTIDEINALKAKRKELKNLMKINAAIKILRIVSTACMFFGSAGAAAGTVIGSITSVAESLTQGKPISTSAPTTKPRNFEENLQRFARSTIDFLALFRADQDTIRQVTQGIDDLEKVLKDHESLEARVRGKLVPLEDEQRNNQRCQQHELEVKSRLGCCWLASSESPQRHKS